MEYAVSELIEFRPVDNCNVSLEVMLDAAGKITLEAFPEERYEAS
jgi:hypothetical protein